MRNRSFSVIIYGNPITKMRARINTGNQKRFYDAQQHEKQAERIYIASHFGNSKQFEGPCKLVVTYYMPIKKSHNVPEGTYHYYKGDIDNLLKWSMDNLTYTAFKNDCIISSVEMKKVYAKVPRTEILLTELEDHESVKEEPNNEARDPEEYVLRRIQGPSRESFINNPAVSRGVRRPSYKSRIRL